MLYLAVPLVNAVATRSDFTSYKVKFAKSYAGHAQEEYAFNAYVANMAKVAELTAKAKAVNATVVYGETKFSDLTPKEFSDIHGYKPRKDRFTGKVEPFSGPCTACDKKGLEEVRGNLYGREGAKKNALGLYADSFDWVTKGAVTPVKDQGQCGSCTQLGSAKQTALGPRLALVQCLTRACGERQAGRSARPATSRASTSSRRASSRRSRSRSSSRATRPRTRAATAASRRTLSST